MDTTHQITGLDIKMADLCSRIYWAKAWNTPAEVARKLGLNAADILSLAIEDDPHTHCPRWEIIMRIRKVKLDPDPP